MPLVWGKAFTEFEDMLKDWGKPIISYNLWEYINGHSLMKILNIILLTLIDLFSVNKAF